jgi:hypothetical protein
MIEEIQSCESLGQQNSTIDPMEESSGDLA